MPALSGCRPFGRLARDNGLMAARPADCRCMIAACRRGPPASRVDNVDVEPVDLDVLPQGFAQLPTV